LEDPKTFFVSGICQWNVPEGGLFLWLKAFGIGDTWDMLMERGLKKNVMLVPGRAFATKKSMLNYFLSTNHL